AEPGEDVALDLLGVRARGDVEQRPAVLDEELADAVADDLEHLLAHPGADAVGDATHPDESGDQHLGLDDAVAELAVDHRLGRDARLRILHAADAAAELDAGLLADVD